MEVCRTRRALECSQPESLPPCLNTKKCAGEKYYFSDCPQTGNEEAIVLLSEYKNKRDADKKNANFKKIGQQQSDVGQQRWPDRVSHCGESRIQGRGIGRNRLCLLRYTAPCCGGRKEAWFSLKVTVLPEPIMLNMAISGESDKQKCSATEMLMSAVTITTPSGLLCMRGVRQIIVEKDMDHPLIGRPVLDEMGFVASQHLDSVRDKFHLHDFSHIGEDLFDIGRQPLGALSKLLLKPADIPEFIEDLQDVPTLKRKKNMKLREQTKPNELDEDQCEVQRRKVYDRDHDVLQPNVKFASLKEQALFLWRHS
jgi:hypothetical protein